MIWAAPIREEREEKQEKLGDQTVITVTYKYFGYFAIGLCEGPIDKILRIWADTKLIFSLREDNDEIVQIPGLKFRIYDGDFILPEAYNIYMIIFNKKHSCFG